MASRAGRAKPAKEVRQLKSEVRNLIEDIRGGTLDRADGQTMLQGYRVLREFVALERTIAEEDELRVRLDELEDALRREGSPQGRRAWG